VPESPDLAADSIDRFLCRRGGDGWLIWCHLFVYVQPRAVVVAFALGRPVGNQRPT